MSTATQHHHLHDDHIALLVTAARRWGVLTDPTTAAFTAGRITSDDAAAGQLIREENTRAAARLAEAGRARLIERAIPEPYEHTDVERVDPIEVIKAAHAAQHICSSSPTWLNSDTRRLLAMVITAATHRLDGYAEAPWQWTRRRHAQGPAIGVTVDQNPPTIENVRWVQPEAVRKHWTVAPLILVQPTAAAQIPADLAPHARVVLLTTTEDHNTIWQAVTSLHLHSLVVHWPTCSSWLAQQIGRPQLANQHVSHDG